MARRPRGRGLQSAGHAFQQMVLCGGHVRSWSVVQVRGIDLPILPAEAAGFRAPNGWDRIGPDEKVKASKVDGPPPIGAEIRPG